MVVSSVGTVLFQKLEWCREIFVRKYFKDRTIFVYATKNRFVLSHTKRLKDDTFRTTQETASTDIGKIFNVVVCSRKYETIEE